MILIMSATGGVGRHTALQLAQNALQKITITGRNIAVDEAAVMKIVSKTKNQQTTYPITDSF